MQTNIQLLSNLAHIIVEREMLKKKVVEKIKTHILCSVTFFFFENSAVYEKMWKNIVESGRATEDKMTLAHCMLNT